MAGSAYSYIGALVVGPWTSMAACLAQPAQSPWRLFEGGRNTRSVVKGQHREIPIGKGKGKTSAGSRGGERSPKGSPEEAEEGRLQASQHRYRGLPVWQGVHIHT